MVHLIRFKTNDFGTQGMLFLPSGWSCCTMEPSWVNNLKNISCIPAGEYDVVMVESPSRGPVYEVLNVPDRTDILFHVGNYAGLTKLGHRSDTEGCILPGRNHGYLEHSGIMQEVVLSSRVTLEDMENQLRGESFTLKILGVG